jgi:hypothetical protein
MSCKNTTDCSCAALARGTHAGCDGCARWPMLISRRPNDCTIEKHTSTAAPPSSRGIAQRIGPSLTLVLSYAMVMMGTSSSRDITTLIAAVNGWHPRKRQRHTVDRVAANAPPREQKSRVLTVVAPTYQYLLEAGIPRAYPSRLAPPKARWLVQCGARREHQEPDRDAPDRHHRGGHVDCTAPLGLPDTVVACQTPPRVAERRQSRDWRHHQEVVLRLDDLAAGGDSRNGSCSNRWRTIL